LDGVRFLSLDQRVASPQLQQLRLEKTTNKLKLHENYSSKSSRLKDDPEDNHEKGYLRSANKIETKEPTITSLIDVLPTFVQPYCRLIRLDRPWGSMLLLWPCFWSTALAAQPLGSLPDLQLLGLFATGSFIMRGAGCIINDMWDVDYDKHVERTKNRPLASGEVSMKQATFFLGGNLLCGLGILVSLPHTAYCVKLGMLSMPLVIAYPLMKRYTGYPQFILGLTFNWGALMGWAAVHGSLDNLEVVFPLYASGVTWTLVYDTLYAHQDKKDDAALGLKSTALTFGDTYTKPILHGFAAMSLLGWSAAGFNAGIFSPIYYMGMASAWSHLTWQIATAELNDPQNLAKRFRSNQLLGGIVFSSIVAGNVAMGL